jgi:hypothetical protein
MDAKLQLKHISLQVVQKSYGLITFGVQFN